MSQTEEEPKTERVSVLVADTDLFFFYLKGGKYEIEAREIIRRASSGLTEIRASSEVYDDAISALRSDNIALETIHEFISKMKSIPHKALPMSAEVAEDALKMYIEHGGRRKLSYFDSFHVATAKRYSLPLLTSDAYMINHAKELGITAINLGS